MTTTWTCRECGTVNDRFIVDCGTCGASVPRSGTGGVLAAEVLQNTESLGELRMALAEALRRIGGLEAQMADTRHDWLPGIDRRVLCLENEPITVTTPPAFVDNAELEISYD